MNTRRTLLKYRFHTAISLLMISVVFNGFQAVQIHLDQKNIEEARTRLETADAKDKATAEEIGNLMQQQNDGKNTIAQLETERNDLMDKIAAFAKQAAACEDIKKKLKIK